MAEGICKQSVSCKADMCLMHSIDDGLYVLTKITAIACYKGPNRATFNLCSQQEHMHKVLQPYVLDIAMIQAVNPAVHMQIQLFIVSDRCSKLHASLLKQSKQGSYTGAYKHDWVLTVMEAYLTARPMPWRHAQDVGSSAHPPPVRRPHGNSTSLHVACSQQHSMVPSPQDRKCGLDAHPVVCGTCAFASCWYPLSTCTLPPSRMTKTAVSCQGNFSPRQKLQVSKLRYTLCCHRKTEQDKAALPEAECHLHHVHLQRLRHCAGVCLLMTTHTTPCFPECLACCAANAKAKLTLYICTTKAIAALHG